MQNDTEAEKFIIRALADDYESFATLVNYYTGSKKPTLTRSEVSRTLADLVTNGFIQSLSYSEIDQKFTVAAFLPSAIEGFWFRLTPRGKELLLKWGE